MLTQMQLDSFSLVAVSCDALISVRTDRDLMCQLKLELSQHIIGQIFLCVRASARITPLCRMGGGSLSFCRTQNSTLGPQPESPLLLSSLPLASPANTIETSGGTSVCVTASDCVCARVRACCRQTVMALYSAGQPHYLK